jgi:hypothetical protein
MTRKLLLLGVLAAIPLLAGCQPPTASWQMNETSGNRMADSAGNHTGTLHDVGFTSAGHDGGAYRFNGDSSYVQVPDADDLDPGSGDFTYSAWINTKVLPPDKTSDIMRKGVSTTSGGDFKLELFPVNGAARARCVIRGSNGEATAGGGDKLQDGRWHHLACSREGSTLTLTIDGTKVKSTSKSVGSIKNASDVTIGAKSADQDHFAGLIDQVQIAVG